MSQARIDNDETMDPSAEQDVIIAENLVTIGSNQEIRPQAFVAHSESIVCPAKGFILVRGPKKSGKTSVLLGLSAKMLNPLGENMNLTFGFLVKDNSENLPIVFFEPENPMETCQAFKSQIAHRAGFDPDGLPENFFFYSLRGYSNHRDRYAKVERTIKALHARYGGIHAVMVDSLADITGPTNDENNAEKVTTLHSMCEAYGFTLAASIHTVAYASGESEKKSYGMVGTKAEAKADAIIDIKPERSGGLTSTMRFAYLRHGHIPVPVFLRFDQSQGLFVLADEVVSSVNSQSWLNKRDPEVVRFTLSRIWSATSHELSGGSIKTALGDQIHNKKAENLNALFNECLEVGIISANGQPLNSPNRAYKPGPQLIQWLETRGLEFSGPYQPGLR